MPQPAKRADPDDPYAFVAQRYQAEPGTDPDAVMTRCLVEEFALLGYPPERILRLFQIPTYRASHDVLRRRGEPFVREIIGGVFGRAPAETLPVSPREESA